ncbi:MAG: glutathione S-transferase family protein, partial [Gammaproteobacteria bacterium]|nr:glutathione S-transferase family protein [Gammaproteobacteria bacterium]
MSPYSEKLRAAMGFSGISWQSVVVPEQPPRALLDGLIGGYRRIPVLQMGAQFYCDTRLAFEALDVG